MRDPERIEAILAEIKSVWNQCPELRLGQLILNSVSADELYNMSDAKLLGLLTGALNALNHDNVELEEELEYTIVERMDATITHLRAELAKARGKL